VSVHREFSYESSRERILKIGPNLPKLLSNIKGYTFFETQCTYIDLLGFVLMSIQLMKYAALK